MVKAKGLLPPKFEHFLISKKNICGDIYLVGGAIRNAFLLQPAQDYDFIVQENPDIIAKSIADFFQGDCYVMDRTRRTSRALIFLSGKKYKIDVAQMVGGSIEADLLKRDFTINAIAKKLPLNNEVIDPLEGKSDILNSFLRPCSMNSFEDDPVRVIRAVRFLNEFDLTINSIDIDRIRIANESLIKVSDERKRDEIINILDKTDVKQSLSQMLEFGILETIFPEVAGLRKIELDPPHVFNAWTHTLFVVAYCQLLLNLFCGNLEVKGINPRISQAFRKLKKFQQPFLIDLDSPITPERSKRSLFLLAGAFHDAGKGVVEPICKDGKKCFPKHAKVGSGLIKAKAKMMGFSRNEIDFLIKMVQFHMDPSKLTITNQYEKDVQIYRFMNKVGSAGVFVGLLHLADVLATYGETITDYRWDRAISVVCDIFNAYYFRYNEFIQPQKLLNGNDLINDFNLAPGKKIGQIIETVVEAQVRGVIQTKNQAKNFVEELLSKDKSGEN